MPADLSSSRFEDVFTETDYYDGPRKGVANFCGSPHFYDCVFSDERQDYTNHYRLTLVSADTFQLALEDWAIWLRWEKAFKAGQTTLETHPALPQEAARHIEIDRVLAVQLSTDMESSITRSAKFLILNPPEERDGFMINLRVQWSEPSGKLDESIWAESPLEPESKLAS
jgi:hypothetical protein